MSRGSYGQSLFPRFIDSPILVGPDVDFALANVLLRGWGSISEHLAGSV